MNQTVKKINEEKVLFFDLEVVRKNKELNINSKEFELFQKKTRNKETDKLLPDNEVVEQYNKRAALKMCYTKIVSIGVGFIKEGEVHIKALEGDEENLLKQFCTIANSFDYVCGANILAYDLPMVVANGMKYFDVPVNLVDRFITSGKKPWELKFVIDLMDVFRGTHYANTSVDEMCYHFDLPSPKTDLDGSMVSEEYWINGLDKINKYVKQDVFASVNIFKKMRFEESFENFLDKNENITSEPFVQEVELTLLQKLDNNKSIYTSELAELKTILNKPKLAKNDREIVFELIKASLSEIDQNFGKVVNQKEIDQIINQLKEELENN
jgi:3'-5' exonuclease